MRELNVQFADGDGAHVERVYDVHNTKNYRDRISATSLNDSPLTIHFMFHNNGAVPEPLYRTVSIKDIAGAVDGANSVITLQRFDLFPSAFDDPISKPFEAIKTHRVRETVDQLRVAFSDAGVPMPKIKAGIRATIGNALKYVFD